MFDHNMAFCWETRNQTLCSLYIYQHPMRWTPIDILVAVVATSQVNSLIKYLRPNSERHCLACFIPFQCRQLESESPWLKMFTSILHTRHIWNVVWKFEGMYYFVHTNLKQGHWGLEAIWCQLHYTHKLKQWQVVLGKGCSFFRPNCWAVVLCVFRLLN